MSQSTDLKQEEFEEQLNIHESNSYPKRSGNHIGVFLNGTDFYNVLQTRCANAKYSIWCGVSFGSFDFQFPNGMYWWGFFKQLKEKNPSLNIRVLFWRNTDKRWINNTIIPGNENNWNFINKHDLQKYIQFKWDESPNESHCHHGKYFVIDAECNSFNTATCKNIYSFVGGMILKNSWYANDLHDCFIEINGNSSIDVINNFKLRWNHNNIFTKCVAMEKCKPFVTDIIDLKFEQQQQSTKVKGKNDTESKENKEDEIQGVDVQICCTIYPNLYPNYNEGESSVHYQYYKAFLNAKSSIYIESTHPGDKYLLKIMKSKLENNKDFKIIFVVPIRMMHAIKKAKKETVEYENRMKQYENDKDDNNMDLPKKPRSYDVFSTLSSLKQFDNFCLCGMYQTKQTENEISYEIYRSHSKICIVDGKWFTVGSANFVSISFIHDHSEINACIFNEVESMKLLKELCTKHCQQNMENEKYKKMNDSVMIQYMMDTARDNINRKASNIPLNGRLYALDPETYAT